MSGMFEKRYKFYRPKYPLVGFKDKQSIENYTENDLSKFKAFEYAGDYTFLGYAGSGMTGSMVMFVSHDYWHRAKTEAITFKPRKITTMGGYHGSDLNTNLVVGLNKKDLLALAEQMDDTDVLNIAHCDTYRLSKKDGSDERS